MLNEYCKEQGMCSVIYLFFFSSPPPIWCSLLMTVTSLGPSLARSRIWSSDPDYIYSPLIFIISFNLFVFLVSMTSYSSELRNLIVHFKCYIKYIASSENYPWTGLEKSSVRLWVLFFLYCKKWSLITPRFSSWHCLLFQISCIFPIFPRLSLCPSEAQLCSVSPYMEAVLCFWSSLLSFLSFCLLFQMWEAELPAAFNNKMVVCLLSWLCQRLHLPFLLDTKYQTGLPSFQKSPER